MSLQSPRVRGAILCDDVRTELNGKHILIGIYGPEIGVQEIPGKAKFRLAVLVDVPRSGDFDLKIRVLDTSNRTAIEANILMKTEKSGQNILIPGIEVGLDIQKSGSVIVQYFDGAWMSVGVWTLEKIDPATIALGPHEM